MSNVMLTTATIQLNPHSHPITTDNGMNVRFTEPSSEASIISSADNCGTYAYRHYHSHNYDVYNSDGVVIGRDT
jgi:hypothetical protein